LSQPFKEIDMAASTPIFDIKKANSLKATANNQALYGGADTTGGSSGHDTLNSGLFTSISLYGGDGNDTLVAKDSDVTIDGGAGTDTVQFAASVSGGHADGWLVDVENIVITRKTKGSYDFSDQFEKLNITGGSGDDTIYGGSGIDTIRGCAGNDKLYVQVTDQLIDGGAGVDTAVFDNDVASDDLDNAKLISVEKIVIEGTAAGSYDFSGQTEALDITASSNGDAITGGTGADTISGGAGSDTLVGGKGNDVLEGAENDLLDGGDGVDTASFAGTVASANLADENLVGVEKIVITALVDGGRFDFSEQTEDLTITGSAYGDAIDGGAGANTINGGGGNDSLTGYVGNDVLNGDDGNDNLTGGYGSDQLNGGAGKDTLSGGDGTDLLNGGADVDALDGGVGDDTLNGGAGVDTLAGDDGDDALNGDDGNDNLDGGAGADMLKGGTGDDTLDGGAGVDVLNGGAGNDILTADDTDALIDGGAGTDTVQFAAGVSKKNLLDKDMTNIEFVNITSGSAGTYDFSAQTEKLTIQGASVNDSVIGGQASDKLYGGDGDDTLAAQDIDALIDGGIGADTVQFSAAVSATKLLDVDLVNVEVIEITNELNARYDFSVQTEKLEIAGWAGSDTLVGGRNDDTISGGGLGDSLAGGAGDDVIKGDAGNDMLTGGAGGDTFQFASGDSGVVGAGGFDIITDFVVGEDALEFDAGSVVGDSSSEVDQASGNYGKDITATVKDGVIALDGKDESSINSLSEWLAVARVVVDDAGEVGVFEFNGSTYVYQENGDDDDLLIQLLGVKGVVDADGLLADS
jgi:Ca2+-binding RTX toxin-like protein